MERGEQKLRRERKMLGKKKKQRARSVRSGPAGREGISSKAAVEKKAIFLLLLSLCFFPLPLSRRPAIHNPYFVPPPSPLPRRRPMGARRL